MAEKSKQVVFSKGRTVNRLRLETDLFCCDGDLEAFVELVGRVFQNVLTQRQIQWIRIGVSGAHVLYNDEKQEEKVWLKREFLS